MAVDDEEQDSAAIVRNEMRLRRQRLNDRIHNDDEKLAVFEQLYVRLYSDLVGPASLNPEVLCGMCGWLNRYDNLPEHYYRHSGFGTEPFAVSKLSDCVYYTMGWRP